MVEQKRALPFSIPFSIYTNWDCCVAADNSAAPKQNEDYLSPEYRANKSQTLSLISQCSNSENLVKCLFCDTHTNVATSRGAYLEHLKKTHRLEKKKRGKIILVETFELYQNSYKMQLVTTELIELGLKVSHLYLQEKVTSLTWISE